MEFKSNKFRKAGKGQMRKACNQSVRKVRRGGGFIGRARWNCIPSVKTVKKTILRIGEQSEAVPGCLLPVENERAGCNIFKGWVGHDQEESRRRGVRRKSEEEKPVRSTQGQVFTEAEVTVNGRGRITGWAEAKSAKGQACSGECLFGRPLQKVPNKEKGPKGGELTDLHRPGNRITLK